MKILEFTVEEINLISIYEMDSRIQTIYRIFDTYPLMDEDIQEIADSAARKLHNMTDEEFLQANFIPTE